MCWKYEDKYKECFDITWLGIIAGEPDGIKEKLEEAGVKFNHELKCNREFFNLLSKWHEEGSIEPEERE